MFEQYCDAGVWMSRGASDKGHGENMADDERLFGRHPDVQLIRRAILRDIKKRIKPHREKYESGKIKWGNGKQLG